MWGAKPLSSIELRHLRYFLAAAEHGSFRKAGIALAMQVSSVSRRIRDLEDRLDASLFQGNNGGVLLTLAGRQLLQRRPLWGKPDLYVSDLRRALVLGAPADA